ncbi:hypothetical protein Pla52o_37520 [Novipirellula galeiformis]|uniref:Probable inorganic carbon transporter subunit DabA n=1 Tax=Novipirellula galeiformis TaxID=2528004 RepID=A0A5C6CC03_9BACT|nr:DUF2309 domain-containing protein [Novipirellula galeiformis]TWU21565.1 hypothetical protein Pla52o_37520 [Novipirellula galeiformis]
MQDAVASLVPSQDAPTDHSSNRQDKLRSAIEHAAHYLPSQGPISIFVHHNTLHSFEEMPFDEAVVEGGKLYGCEPYLSEGRYRDELNRGRISVDDLRQVLMDHLEEEADELVASFGTRYTLRLAMLQMTLHSVPDAELRWLLAETDMLRHFRDDISAPRREQMIQRTRAWVMRDRELASHPSAPVASAATSEADASEQLRGTTASRLPPIVETLIAESGGDKIQSWSDAQWEAFVLKLLWRICRAGVSTTSLPSSNDSTPLRIRELLLDATGDDTDALVNDVLIRFCGSFLDQGFANWSLPHRDEGFARAFAKLYLHRMTVKASWMEGIVDELQAILDGPFDPLASIAKSLETLGVEPSDFDSKIGLTLLALKGWAGMIWQVESGAPWLPNHTPAGTLNEYLAIRLMLERYAIAEVGHQQFGTRDLPQIHKLAEQHSPHRHGASMEQRTYTVFQLAQVSGWTPQQLIDMSDPQWKCLVEEIEAFSSLERRRILHGAYERHYQVAALNAIAVHTQRRRELNRREKNRRNGKRPSFVAIFCIDDREESFRRHLEEVDPECETASAAGFFAVAMYYQGADHAHFRPLCPAILTPQHYVREEPMFSTIDVSQRRANRRRRIGRLTHQVHASSRTMIGGWVTGVFGAIATFPMVARILAPGLTSRIRKSFGTFTRPPATELQLERVSAEPGPTPDALGYSLDEMAGIVVRILQDIGVVDDFPRILVFFGHGSASLNNPHESAYNCGACSGGRGGPNARAFAMMANDPRVRRLTAQLGLEIPEDTRFVGAYHNTCSDNVEYYDLDLLPRSHRTLFRRIEKSVNETRANVAHERARRFESAPLDLTPRQALEHVEQRGEDLSQARPEYNHATNALTFVGRREWSRGLFADRRVFLTSYDPSVDDEQVSVLSRILGAAIPVCAGIALEYYFSTVDTEGYGCGSKLPHNVASMLGVMTGAASDLRPGLSQQMVEIHEPLRHLFVIETTPEKMDLVIEGNPAIARLVKGNWVQVALLDPETSTLLRYVKGKYEPFVPESTELAEVDSSIQWYRGQRGHLDFASIKETASKETVS